MFEITLLTVGRLKEKFYLSAAAEYEKRLRGLCSFKLIELTETRLPDAPSPAEIRAGLEKEAEQIFSKSQKGHGSVYSPRRANYFHPKRWRLKCPKSSYQEKATLVF